MYLLWYDDSKKDATAKVADAIAAYRARFKSAPNIVLVNRDEGVAAIVAGCAVRSEGYIRRNNFWIGYEAHL